MILQRLVEYYDRLAADPDTADSLPKRGYSVQKVSFCVVLKADGSLDALQSMLDAGVRKAVARKLLVPGQSKPTGPKLNPCFLWDNSAYLLGYDKDAAKRNRAPAKFAAFRDRHLAARADVSCDAFDAVCSFLSTWTPEMALAHATLLEEIGGSFGVFRMAGAERFVHEDPAVIAYWARQGGESDDAPRGRCLVTGEKDIIARVHEPKIKGVRGTQTADALLVSFNKDAYTSFGKEQGFNAPVGASAAFRYANALNHLLARDSRRVFLGDATVVFWSQRPSVTEGFLSEILAGLPSASGDAPIESRRRVEEIRLFLSQVREGYAGAEAISEEDRTPFSLLALSPNASRVSVRFWLDSTVGAIKHRLAQHMQDTALAGARPDDPPLMIRRIVSATGRAEADSSGRFKGYDIDAVSPLLAGAIARAVLTGGPYPQPLLASLINRLRADGVVRHERIAAIRGCLVRNSRLQGKPREVPVALDTTRCEPAYLAGRLFALLEKIQADGVGDLNATIRERYFSAASATPGIVFPRLIRLTQHHLAKLKPGQRVFYEQQLGEVIGKLHRFPAHLLLEDQGLFAIGYFHQRQDLFTSRKDKEGDTP